MQQCRYNPRFSGPHSGQVRWWVTMGRERWPICDGHLQQAQTRASKPVEEIMPTEQMSLPTAVEEKTKGMTLAAEHRKELLARVRAELRKVASRRTPRTATADDAQEILLAWGYDSSALGNAAGSLFYGWRFTGRWTPSERVSNHAHQNRVWELSGE